MKGDPIGGVHAFYSGSFREWWAPLRPGTRVTRRNALVGVHDKGSEFAGRAVHEWTGEVFAAPDEVLSAQYRLMIRTERGKAEERGKYVETSIEPYTDEEIARSTRLRRGAGAPPWRGAPLVGGRRRGRRARPAREGADAGDRHGLLAHRHGHGPLRREGAAARLRAAPAGAPVLPSRRAQHPRRAAARALGSGVGPPGRQPDQLRLRADARDVAHPPLHRLDGRRRVALEARLPVPQVQLRRRHPLDARARRAQGPRRRRPPGRRPRAGGENQRGETTTPGHATILLPSREHGPVRLPEPPGGATTCQEALDALVARFAAEERA